MNVNEFRIANLSEKTKIKWVNKYTCEFDYIWNLNIKKRISKAKSPKINTFYLDFCVSISFSRMQISNVRCEHSEGTSDLLSRQALKPTQIKYFHIFYRKRQLSEATGKNGATCMIWPSLVKACYTNSVELFVWNLCKNKKLSNNIVSAVQNSIRTAYYSDRKEIEETTQFLFFPKEVKIFMGNQLSR